MGRGKIGNVDFSSFIYFLYILKLKKKIDRMIQSSILKLIFM